MTLIVRGILSNWVSAKSDLIGADVIRWTETVFQRGRSKKSKAKKIGERAVIAQILQREDGDWLKLVVSQCTVTRSDFAGTTVEIFKPETHIKRALRTVLKGKAERLLWSDESVRSSLLANPPID